MMEKADKFRSSTGFFILITLSVFFVAELVTMFLFADLLPRSNKLLYAISDAFLMIIISSPFMWWLVTNHKMAVDALRESEDKFRFVFEHSIIGKSFTLTSGEIYANNALYEMLGYSQEELHDHRWQDITHPDDRNVGSKGERKPPTSVVGIANPLHEYDAHPKNVCENQFAGEQNVYKGLERSKVCENQSDCDDKRNLGIAENARENFRRKSNALDVARAKMLWPGLEPVLSEAILRVKQTAIGKVCPASFGFNRIQSQSGSLVKSATIISEAMDDVILQTKDESHRELI